MSYESAPPIDRTNPGGQPRTRTGTDRILAFFPFPKWLVRLAADLDRIQPTIDRLTTRQPRPGESPIRGVGSWIGPLALTASFTAVDILLTSLE
jgi:hypothetical protein